LGENHGARRSGSAKVGRQHGIASCQGRGFTEPRRPREWKSVRLRGGPRSIASGQSRMRRFAQGSSPRPHGVTLIFRCQCPRPDACANYLAASALRSSGRQEVTPSGGKRIAVRSRGTAGAIRGFPEDRARQNNILWEAARRAPALARSGLPKQRARGKPEPPKASRHSCKQQRRKPERSKDRDDDDERDLRREYRIQIRRGSS
jgi:hypothetical protein